MPIPKSVVDKYLARTLPSLAWAKNLKPLEVEEELSYIKPAPRFHCPLRVDQKILFLLGIAYPEIVFMSDLGSGKTSVSLELLSYFYEHGFMRRGFVFTPTDEVAEGWEDEITKWGFDLPFVRLTGSSQNKWEQHQSLSDGIRIGTYMGISAMVAKLVAVEGSEKRKRQIVSRLILGLTNKVDAVVYDQCFPAGTSISTIDGPRSIEQLKNGDLVLSSDLKYHRIRKLHCKQSQLLSKLHLSNGTTLAVTPDHPFFTDVGWVCAGNTKGRYLYDKSSLRKLWGYVPQSQTQHSSKEWEDTNIQILQHVLLDEIAGIYSFPREAKSESSCPQRKAEVNSNETKTTRDLLTDWEGAASAWRKRNAYAVASAAFTDYIKPALDTRVRHFIKAEASRLSNLLQSRLCPSSEDADNRSGRVIPLWYQTKDYRREEGSKIDRIRVDRIENIKLDSPQDVYTLEVEDCPHFFADGFLVHNSTKLGNTKSLSYQVCREFSLEAQLRYALAGRAFGRDAFILWSQFMLTDRGHALGRSPGMFREAFWRRVQSPWGTSWTIRKRREPQLATMIAASSIRYAIDECVQLPPKSYVRKECTFPDENWAYYDRVREELLAAKGNYREIKNSFLRMRQISSGFVGFKDDETGERAQIEFEHNPKLDLLIELVNEVPDEYKMVIFYEFTWSGARICQELARNKLRFGWLWQGTKDWTKIKTAFNEDPSFRIIVANWKKGSMGLNLQSANYTFYHESPVSSIERYESEGRTHRTGQKHKTMYYDLIVKNSADDMILQYHNEGNSLWKALVENPGLVKKKYGSR